MLIPLRALAFPHASSAQCLAHETCFFLHSCYGELCAMALFLGGHVYKCTCALNCQLSNSGHSACKGSWGSRRSTRTRNFGEQQHLPSAKCSWEEKMISWKYFHWSYLFFFPLKSCGDKFDPVIFLILPTSGRNTDAQGRH